MSTKEWVIQRDGGASIYQECFYDFDKFELNPNPVVLQVDNPTNFFVSREELHTGNTFSQIMLEISAQEFDEIAAAWCLKRKLNINKFTHDELLNKSELEDDTQSCRSEDRLDRPSGNLDSLFDKELRAINDPTIFYRFFSPEDTSTVEKASVLANSAWKFYVSVDEDYRHPKGGIIKAGSFIFSDCSVKLLKFLTDYPNSSKVMYEVETGIDSEVLAKIFIHPLEELGNSPDWIVIDEERPLTVEEEDRFLRKNIIASGHTEPLYFGERSNFSEIEV